jgi:hypothetical protein
MGALSRWAVRKPVVALVAWFIAMAGVIGIGTQLGGEFNDSFSLPDTESTTATLMLSTLPPSGSGEAAVRIVWSPASGSVTDPAVAAEITPVLEEIAALESVTCVTNPYGEPIGRDCPDTGGGNDELPDFLAEQLAPAFEATARATSPISADGTVAFARVSLAGNGAEISGADASAIVAAVKAANSPELAVGASGQVLEFANTAPPSSEAIGILVAIIILLIAFGSIVAVNRTFDRAAAEVLLAPGLFVEVIAAPAFEEAAVELLTTKPTWRASVRMVEVPPGNPWDATAGLELRSVAGGLLAQRPDDTPDDPAAWRVVTQKTPAAELTAALHFAFTLVRRLTSNAICVCQGTSLVGAGVGQTSRVDSVRIALEKAGERARGAVLASDAFFPFPDSIELIQKAGIAAIVQPGGSKRDPDVIAAADAAGIPMVFTARRHFRH